jgi:hypothetical protein
LPVSATRGASPHNNMHPYFPRGPRIARDTLIEED